MLYTGVPFIGVTEDPLIKSPYVASWNDDTLVPPPPSDLMITETGIFMITQVTLQNMITES